MLCTHRNALSGGIFLSYFKKQNNIWPHITSTMFQISQSALQMNSLEANQYSDCVGKYISFEVEQINIEELQFLVLTHK